MTEKLTIFYQYLIITGGAQKRHKLYTALYCLSEKIPHSYFNYNFDDPKPILAQLHGNKVATKCMFYFPSHLFYTFCM